MSTQLRISDANLPDYLRRIEVISPEETAEVDPS